MSQSNILFEDLLEVESIDKDIKVFEKVQRIEGKTEDSNCEIILDVNSEIYPMQKAVYSILFLFSASEPEQLFLSALIYLDHTSASFDKNLILPFYVLLKQMSFLMKF